jgi:hypothetical protein
MASDEACVRRVLGLIERRRRFGFTPRTPRSELLTFASTLTDDDLLAIGGIGPVTIEGFRRIVPAPLSSFPLPRDPVC